MEVVFVIAAQKLWRKFARIAFGIQGIVMVKPDVLPMALTPSVFVVTEHHIPNFSDFAHL
jgi:hypothetical protein